MGKWSDGSPVAPVEIRDEPPPLDRAEGFWSRRSRPTAAASRPSPRVVRDLAYHEGPDFDEERHRLDLHLPAEGKDFPVILFLHGGAWSMGTKEWYGSSIANIAGPFVENGIAIAMANYRLSPAVRHPEHVRDAARAFAWLKAHAAEYGGDPEHLFLMGHSAGAHLAALLAVNGRFLEEVGASPAEVRGVIPVSGVYEIERAAPRYAFGTDPDELRDASPAAHASGKHPPFFVTVGEFDMRGLQGQAERFCDALRAGGTTVEYVLQTGKTHVTAATGFEDDGNETAAAIVAFVKRHSRREAR
jgi:acetyl esterase/lipase